MRPATGARQAQEASASPSDLAGTGVVLVLVVLTSGRGPLVTAALGGVLAAVTGAWLGRSVLAGAVHGRPRPRPQPRPRATAATPVGPLPVRPPRGTAVAGAPGDGLQVRWWRRDGHDRLYVCDASGRSLGWLERDTGRLEVFDERDRALVSAGVSAGPFPLGGLTRPPSTP